MMAILKARLFEKMNSLSFITLLIFTLFMTVVGTPQAQGAVKTLTIEPGLYYQANNPTWLPIGTALIFGMMLPLIGFTYVRDAVGLDVQTNVISIIKTSKFASLNYTLGKFLANVTLLVGMWVVAIIGTLGMMLLRFPGQSLTFTGFITPFLVLIPGLLLTAAFALLVDTIGIFRKTGGTVLGILVLLTLYILETTTKTASFMV